MIDWPRVKELRDEVGAEDFSEVVDLFLEEVEDVIGRLSQGDAAQLEQDLHFLKGSAMNLGFDEFSALCMDGEQRSAQGDAGSVDLDAIVARFASSKAAFLSGITDLT